MVVLALAILLVGMFRSAAAPATDHLEANVQIARERRTTLTQALANGSIDSDTYQAELHSLESALAQDLAAANVSGDGTRGSVAGAIVIAVLVPIAAGALYLQLGTPQALNADFAAAATVVNEPADSTDTEAPALADLIPNLEQRLAENPDDVSGWKLLGRTYMMTGEFGQAETTLRRALSLDEQDPDILAQLAEAVAMQREGALDGEPAEYLQRALDLDSTHEQSIWLMGIANQQTGNHEAAIVMFEQLAKKAGDNAPVLNSINEMIDRSKAELGIDASQSGQGVADAEGAPATDRDLAAEESASTASDDTAADAAPSASLAVAVSLSPTVAAQVSPEQAVFVYARASNGPPMPLAVARYQVSDLPLTITLDDSMAMMPNMALSGFPEVTVGARVSQSGNAIAEAGDWFGELANVKVAEAQELSIVIDQQK